MKAQILISSILLIFLISCKEIHKKNIEAEDEARKELELEELEKTNKELEEIYSRLPKSDSQLALEESERQMREMNNDKNFIFCKDKNIGFEYVILETIKINATQKESETNAKYKIYKKGKKLNADGIINYKISYNPFYAKGTIVKKK